jgi:exopolysaccharide production protein ExoZ
MLRAIAATMVVFVHMDIQLARLHYGTLGSAWLASGVDIFFVISGFIMWTSVERRSAMSAATFIKHRLIRIVPLYWAVTTFVVIIVLLAPEVVHSTVLQPSHVLASYLFVPARHPVLGVFWPLVIPGWSLNYEMLFYFVFAAAMMMGGTSRMVRMMLIAGGLVGILAIAYLTKGRVDVMNFYAQPVLLEFIVGIILGAIWRLGMVPISPLWLVAVAAGFLTLSPLSPLGGVVAPLVGASLIVAGAVFLPPIAHNPLSALGDASYSLYLTHVITLSAFGLLWAQFLQPLGWQLFVISAVALAIAVAFIIYASFEVPATAALKRLFSRERRIQVAPAATAVDSHQ